MKDTLENRINLTVLLAKKTHNLSEAVKSKSQITLFSCGSVAGLGESLTGGDLSG